MDILARVNKHYEAAVAHYGENAVFGVFLYGSQNYRTNTPESDVDTKCILVPNLRVLALHPYEVKHLNVDGEVCECMSIMHMVNNWKKQNINFVEILFTPYFKVNPKYEDFWLETPDGYEPYALDEKKSERIARYNVNAAVLSMAHQAIHTIKQDPTDLKKLMNAARITHSLFLLTDTNLNYNNVIQATPEIAGIRTGETKLPDHYVDTTLGILNGMIKCANDGQWAPNKEEQAEVDCFLNDFILDLIDRRITLE